MISRSRSVRSSSMGAECSGDNAMRSLDGSRTVGHDEKPAKHFCQLKFEKRECVKFEMAHSDKEICGCGGAKRSHSATALEHADAGGSVGGWTIEGNTQAEPTDAFGTIEFQGGPHPHRAQYVRLGYDSNPEDIMAMFINVWGLKPPKLVITIHGGLSNFPLPAKLSRVFGSGLLKAAKTTGAWIITSGVNAGVVRHVAAALDGGSMNRQRSRIVTIGIAPWGLLKRRGAFIGEDCTIPYHPNAFSPKGRFAVLNDRHSYFLFVDNGSTGRYGADVVLRRRFEEYLTRTSLEVGSRPTPLVSVMVEGGSCAIRSVLDYVTSTPAVPVVVIDGSGRAADLLSFTHNQTADDGTIVEEGMRNHLVRRVTDAFGHRTEASLKVVQELTLCCKEKNLLTIFRLGEETQQDIDHAILTALLKGQQLSAPGQLTLALAWNRVDIARSDIFVLGQEWPARSLEMAMLEALKNDRVDFVKLLLENGVQMDKFLTFSRLEELYNYKNGPPNTLMYIVKDVKVDVISYDLPTIGLAIEKLMGSAYRSNYTTDDFTKRYDTAKDQEASKQPKAKPKGMMFWRKKTSPLELAEVGDIGATSTSSSASTLLQLTDGAETDQRPVVDFKCPFNELFLWAVLTNRQQMVRCMWQHGEEAICKALVAQKLYTSLADEAADDYLEVRICDHFRKCAEEFRRLSLDILSQCYEENDVQTVRMLTCERRHWSRHSCLSLAVLANNKPFVAHPCCQILLADLWLGGLRIRKHATPKVIAGIVCPPSIWFLNFKTKEELLAQPQSLEQHLEDMEADANSGNESDGDKVTTFDDGQRRLPTDIESGDGKAPRTPKKKTRSSSTDSRKKLKRVPANAVPEPIEVEGAVRPRSLSWQKKFHEFYAAPISTFWAFTMAYLVFITLFAYVCLVKRPITPDYKEMYLCAYCIVTFCEQLRKLARLYPEKCLEKLKQFRARSWNIYNVLVSVMFCIGFTLRCLPNSDLREWGRVVMVCNCGCWFYKMYELFSVHLRLGTYITMMGKMVLKMAYIVVILSISMTSFGLVRQAITYPNKEFSWLLVRDIFYKPYFMLYGEVYANEIDSCNDHNLNCVAGHWLPPIYMVVFLLICNVLLINLLIAIFNDVYQETMAISEQIWLFQRYEQVMEFEGMPFLPPPFTVFAHLGMIVKCLLNRCFNKTPMNTLDYNWRSDVALKLFLDDDQVEGLNDFEEDSMEDLQRAKDYERIASTDVRLHRIVEKIEFSSMKLNDLFTSHTHMRTNMHTRMMKAERDVAEVLDLIKKVASSNIFVASTNTAHATPPSPHTTVIDDNTMVEVQPNRDGTGAWIGSRLVPPTVDDVTHAASDIQPLSSD